MSYPGAPRPEAQPGYGSSFQQGQGGGGGTATLSPEQVQQNKAIDRQDKIQRINMDLSRVSDTKLDRVHAFVLEQT